MSISNITYYVGSGKTTFLDLLTGRRKYGTIQVSVTMECCNILCIMCVCAPNTLSLHEYIYV